MLTDIVSQLRIVSLHRLQRSCSPLRRVMARALGVELDRTVAILGPARFFRASGSRVSIGPGTSIVSTSAMTDLGVTRRTILRTLGPGAEIVVGKNCGLSGSVLVAVGRVELGDRVLLGSEVIIADTDFHEVDYNVARSPGVPAADSRSFVIVGDDVFIGARSIILKGVRVGSGAVVGAGSVVVSDVGENEIVGGNPARLLRKRTVKDSA